MSNRSRVVFKNRIPIIKRQVVASSNKKLNALGRMLRSHFKKILKGKRSGREYYVHELGRWYTASAPDEYPAKKLGNLIRSLGS